MGGAGSSGPETAWILSCTALVLLASSGLGVLFAGLIRTGVESLLTHTVVAIAAVLLVWIAIGHTVAYAPTVGRVIGRGGWMGGMDFIGLKDVGDAPISFAPRVPATAFAAFNAMVAVIAVVSVAAAFAGRVKLSAYVTFVVLWIAVAYAPIVHWVWGGGFLGSDGLGAIDEAGGIVVFASAGAAALAAAVVLRGRTGLTTAQALPEGRIVFVPLGTALVWIGFIGLVGGWALGPDAAAALAVVDTLVGGAAGIAGWTAATALRGVRPRAEDAARGAVAGLVAVAAGAGVMRPWSSLVTALVAGVACSFAVELRRFFRDDDAMDIAAVFLGAGVVGALACGFFAVPAGAVYSGDLTQLGKQAAAATVVAGWSFLICAAVLKVYDGTFGLGPAAAVKDSSNR